MLRPKSLQSRLLLGILVSLTVTLALGGMVVYRVVDAHLREEFDSSLREKLRFYTSTVFLEGEYARFNMGKADWRRVSDPANPDYVSFRYLPGGRSVGRLFEWQSVDLRFVPITDDTPVFSDEILAGKTRLRMVSQVITPVQKGPFPPTPYRMQVAVARDTSSLLAALNDVRWFLIKTAVLTTGALMLSARWIVRRGVRPVGVLTKQIEAMPLVDSNERFGLPGAPSELQPVVGRLNALMDRVGAAIDHERMFTSNAAHELRNPLAAIRSTVELALSRTRRPEEYEETLESVLESQNGMQRVVDHLLLLARLESGHQVHEFSMEAISLSKLLRTSWRPSFDRATDRKLKVSWQVDEPPRDLMIPAALIGIVLRNLFDNASSYTPEGGHIRISASVADNIAHISVANTNPGVTTANLENTFAPFWRSDPNASGHRGNAGIGLALVRRIMDTMKGKVEARLEGDFLVYALEFPASFVEKEPAPIQS